MRRSSLRHHGIWHRHDLEHGSALIFALVLILVLAIAGIAIVRIAGNDRIAAAQLGVEDRGLACAEAGLQYARRYFGTRYATSNGWNSYLDGTLAGYRYDPAHFPTDSRDLSTKPADAKGTISGGGTTDYWISIRDDDDEQPVGAVDNRSRDNNELVIIRSECVNPAYAMTRGGQPVSAVLESTLVNIQGGSGYGTSGPTNAPDIVGGR